eukprot:CAMPEP_0170486438 /NCGR_PEP_ID=MMETSP0208-20121228/5468_1 /TAXON_ID=197538 /ORGANISM="Strombidium inclinatum, Strain S3" /LENGTH=147 /DNA_ID=CAMNT_0010760387 /DNA_START=574 /DNA_END=1017 /DNA_ORIENTATION=-
MGSKYKWEGSKNPGPGAYELEGPLAYTKGSKPTSAMLKPDNPGSKIARDRAKSPDPGQYDGHLRPLGEKVRNQVNISKSSPFKFKPDFNPPPGSYEVGEAYAAILPEKKVPLMKEGPERFRKKPNLGPGYQGDLNSFGSATAGGIDI